MYCGCIREDALHTFFECEQWGDARCGLEEAIGQYTPYNLIRLLLQSEDTWARTADFVEVDLPQKKTDADAAAPR
ncbi:hypothetical protein DD594_26435 [Enterobacter cloacae complex sp. 4DZ1-17B1]|nr:hypothetical protein DD594_26435 [Enterobacter cloacae complex sp. 4DZ1-17B1]